MPKEQKHTDIRELLREIEWTSVGMAAFAACPCCGGMCPESDSAKKDWGPRQKVGHERYCRLTAALKEEGPSPMEDIKNG